MFAYCNNNPVNTSDPTGELGLFAAFGIGALFGGLSKAAAIVRSDGWGALGTGDAWKKIGISAAIGGGLGMLGGHLSPATMTLRMLLRAGSSFAGNVATMYATQENVSEQDWWIAGTTALIGGLFSVISYTYIDPLPSQISDVLNPVVDGAVDVCESAIFTDPVPQPANTQQTQVKSSAGYTPKYKPVRCGHYVSALD